MAVPRYEIGVMESWTELSGDRRRALSRYVVEAASEAEAVRRFRREHGRQKIYTIRRVAGG